MPSTQDRIAAVHWFHQFDFGNGLYTHGADAAGPMRHKAELVFRHPVAGKTVLDIGAWDGYFSFDAERRGASRVLATDYFCWGGPGWGTQDGFNLARELLHSRVEDREIDVLDISPDTVGTFDVVLFLGVLYHVTDPIAYLHRVYSVTREMAVIETALDLEDIDRPALSFVNCRDRPTDPRAPLSNDPTNFFGPNSLAVIAMLEHVGFSRVEKEIVWEEIPRGYFYAFR